MGRKSNLETGVAVSLDTLGEEIRKVSQIGKAITASKFKRKGLVLLLAEISGVNRTDINKVLDALPELEKEYLK